MSATPTMSATPIAFWLLPAAPLHGQLQARITELSALLGTPIFEPHVSLHVGVETPADDPAALLETLAARVAPFDMVAGPTEHTAVRFKTLFVTFDDDRPAQLQRFLQAGLSQHADYALAPHLSLMYAAPAPASLRAALAQWCSYAGQSMHFDTVAAVRPGPAGFADVARWDTRLRRTLRRLSPP